MLDILSENIGVCILFVGGILHEFFPFLPNSLKDSPETLMIFIGFFILF